MPLSRQDILNAIDLEMRTVFVEKWGGDVCLRSMSGAERDQMEGRFRLAGDDPDAYKNIRAFVLSLVLCDEQRFRLFTEPADIAALGEKNAKVLDELFEIALDMNGIGDEAIDDAKKNYELVLNDGSGFSSP